MLGDSPLRLYADTQHLFLVYTFWSSPSEPVCQRRIRMEAAAQRSCQLNEFTSSVSRSVSKMQLPRYGERFAFLEQHLRVEHFSFLSGHESLSWINFVSKRYKHPCMAFSVDRYIPLRVTVCWSALLFRLSHKNPALPLG